MGSDETLEVCLNKFLGKCPDCTPDYETFHSPNNYDCPGYQRLPLIAYKVDEKEEDGML